MALREAHQHPLVRPPPLEEIPSRPEVKDFARAWVQNLVPLLGRRDPTPKRRLLLLFLDGMGGSTLDRVVSEGRMPFLGKLLDHPAYERADAFSGMPSTTTAFQAGLFYGLRHPDIPGFCWFDRERWRPVRMAAPKSAVEVEEKLIGRAGPGLFEDGTTYLSILRGGARNYGSTAGLWPLISGPRLPPLIPGDFVGGVWVHLWTAARVLLRAMSESPFLLRDIRRFQRWSGGPFEGSYVIHHLFVANLLQEMGRSQVLFDLVRGVPRMFHCIHDYDEVSHRRGTSEAKRTLRLMDRRLEHLVSVAAATPDPPDVWIITDHGLIPSVPFAHLMGCSLKEWLLSPGSELPPALRPDEKRAAPPGPEPAVIDSGNYAHVYLSPDGPLTVETIASQHGEVLARALDCPGIGLVAMRTEEGAIAYAGSRRVDPDDPETLPRGVSQRALRAFLDDLPHTPSAGDLVLFGSWFDDACVAFTTEYASHGGLSPEETSVFTLRPAGGIDTDLSEVSHAAELHELLRQLYGILRPKDSP